MLTQEAIRELCVLSVSNVTKPLQEESARVPSRFSAVANCVKELSIDLYKPMGLNTFSNVDDLSVIDDVYMTVWEASAVPGNLAIYESDYHTLKWKPL